MDPERILSQMRKLGIGGFGLMLIAACGAFLVQRHGAPAQQRLHSDESVLPLVQHVDPFIGTIGEGNLFPGATLPHGMVQWSPDTSAGGLTRPGGYNYGDLIIRDFSLTHLSGAGCVAFGDIPFMPTTRPVTVAPLPNGSPYSTRFDHRHERASPGSYAVRLGSGIQVELTVTPRTGFASFTYPAGAPANLLVNPGGSAGARTNTAGSRSATVHILRHNEITGSATGGRFCGLNNVYTIYFAAQFDHPFRSFGTWRGSAISLHRRSSAGPRTGAFVTFDTRQSRVVRVKVGVSYVDEQNALLNLRAENRGWDFAAVSKRASATWNRLLNRIQATGGSAANETIFYTALYHALLEPTVFSDANGQYTGFDRKLHVARGYVQYANFSGWDIYRSQVQLLAWLTPRETGDMMQSLVADAQQGGWLPKWPVANDYTGEMDGDSADPIITDAYAFGARRFDARTALRFMVKGATQVGTGLRGYVERPGLRSYLRLGYVPTPTGGSGSAATSLEYALDDFTIARMAALLGEAGTSATFLRRAGNWRHLFNPRTSFIEPITPAGAFSPRFDPSRTDGFVEGNAWQYSWMVPQNLPALFRAMGGNARVVRRLDRFFEQLNAGPRAPYYWAGNEPGLEVPWEYDFAGSPRRTQAVVRQIVRELYTAKPDGLPGNDDLGTLSAWYVWAAIGLYPEIPGVAGFALGSPLFKRVQVRWGAGNVLSISAPQAAPATPYAQSLRLDGHTYRRTWLPLKAVAGKTTLSFTLAHHL